LTICTLGLNDTTTDQLAAMLRVGTLSGLRLAMSSYFKASDPETAAREGVDGSRRCGRGGEATCKTPTLAACDRPRPIRP
jgi:hypothetical protein